MRSKKKYKIMLLVFIAGIAVFYNYLNKSSKPHEKEISLKYEDRNVIGYYDKRKDKVVTFSSKDLFKLQNEDYKEFIHQLLQKDNIIPIKVINTMYVQKGYIEGYNIRMNPHSLSLEGFVSYNSPPYTSFNIFLVPYYEFTESGKNKIKNYIKKHNAKEIVLKDELNICPVTEYRFVKVFSDEYKFVPKNNVVHYAFKGFLDRVYLGTMPNHIAKVRKCLTNSLDWFRYNRLSVFRQSVKCLNKEFDKYLAKNGYKDCKIRVALTYKLKSKKIGFDGIALATEKDFYPKEYKRYISPR